MRQKLQNTEGPSFMLGKLRLEEIQSVTQNHIASEWRSQEHGAQACQFPEPWLSNRGWPGLGTHCWSVVTWDTRKRTLPILSE